MEEAYSELYQQFLRLKSLCLRQAALLHQLTIALQKQGGALPDRELMSIPVQCTQEIPACLLEKPQPLTATAQRGVDQLPKHFGTFSNLLSEDMSRLCVDGSRPMKGDCELVQHVAPLLSMDSSRQQRDSPSAAKHLMHADHVSGDTSMPTVRMPLMGSASRLDDMQGPCDGLLMSDVALHSHVCEFCQAVFPGDTTTRGEFLRHLYTHVN